VNILKTGFFVLLSSFVLVIHAENWSIELYQPERDGQVVRQILKDNQQNLTYESRGDPAGTTEKYLESKKYTTEVLRVNGKTIGFVNYTAYNFELLTFFISRRGLIHLIGIDKNEQSKGYGKLLFQHAVRELKKQKIQYILLSVNRENSIARSLYEKEGFCLMETYSPIVLYILMIDLPADQLPKGNIIQRHPRISLAAVLSCIAGWYLHKNEYLGAALEKIKLEIANRTSVISS
jgi:ribosomal protein S18 acetylase RimI-like enzyme